MAFHNAYEDYQKINEAVALNVFNKKLNVRLFHTPHLAAYDVTTSLQQLLAHKPNIGICKNGSSLIDSIIPSWQRASVAMAIKTLKQSWYEYIENLTIETSFVIWSSENEITGEITVSQKQVAEIHQLLSKKRIFSVQLVHEENFDKSVLQPYSVLISRSSIFEKNPSLVLFGEKFKAPTLIGSFQDLPKLSVPFNFKVANKEIAIEALENTFSEMKFFYYNQFATIPHRLNDRIVMYFPDLSGASLQDQLGLKSEQAFTVSNIPFWNLELWKNWWVEAESEKLIRGLLVIASSAFEKDPMLTKKIEAILQSAREQSAWSVPS